MHAVLLYSGDILMTYAALGLVLYGMRGLGPRAALRVAVCLVVGLALLLLGYGLMTVAFTLPVTPGQFAPEVRAQCGRVSWRFPVGGRGASA